MQPQHTVGGGKLQPGDVPSTGTISGPAPSETGAMLELSPGGTREEPLPSIGEQRRFLDDVDAVIPRGWCGEPSTARIGYGENQGEVLPAVG